MLFHFKLVHEDSPLAIGSYEVRACLKLVHEVSPLAMAHLKSGCLKLVHEVSPLAIG